MAYSVQWLALNNG